MSDEDAEHQSGPVEDRRNAEEALAAEHCPGTAVFRSPGTFDTPTLHMGRRAPNSSWAEARALKLQALSAQGKFAIISDSSRAPTAAVMPLAAEVLVRTWRSHDVLWGAFAEGYGYALERTILLQILRDQGHPHPRPRVLDRERPDRDRRGRTADLDRQLAAADPEPVPSALLSAPDSRIHEPRAPQMRSYLHKSSNDVLFDPSGCCSIDTFSLAVLAGGRSR